MGCHKSKANRLEDKIAQVIIFYQDIINEIRQKRQQYLGKCGDLEDETCVAPSHNEDQIADYDFNKKHTFQTQNSTAGQHNASISNRSTVIFTSKKSLEQAEFQRKSTKADVWRFSGRNSLESQHENNGNKGLPNKSIIKTEEFNNYMAFLKDISSRFDKVKQRQLDVIESYYNTDKQDIQVEFKKYHYKIEKAQKKKAEVERCFNKILNQEQFTPLPDGYYVVNHF